MTKTTIRFEGGPNDGKTQVIGGDRMPRTIQVLATRPGIEGCNYRLVEDSDPPVYRVEEAESE